ncbi:hypothetical protein BCR34DRAFT_1054 [Clohesyomyces aquaticus]|uniref:Uncharacterized protein n=1 Tax=Clohesyomyces aquaticus TaxID=1231657 RepID=A0A1Y2AAZ3_9PLEO|nr:hypothetical protein BCR34DRAFT_1054 [Clohesyomyces aquaticus]
MHTHTPVAHPHRPPSTVLKFLATERQRREPIMPCADAATANRHHAADPSPSQTPQQSFQSLGRTARKLVRAATTVSGAFPMGWGSTLDGVLEAISTGRGKACVVGRGGGVRRRAKTLTLAVGTVSARWISGRGVEVCWSSRYVGEREAETPRSVMTRTMNGN